MCHTFEKQSTRNNVTMLSFHFKNLCKVIPVLEKKLAKVPRNAYKKKVKLFHCLLKETSPKYARPNTTTRSVINFITCPSGYDL